MTMTTATEDWQIGLAAVVGAFPPALAGLSIHMRALIRRESNRTDDQSTDTVKPSRVVGLISTIGQIRQAMANPVPTTPVPPSFIAPTTVPAPTQIPVPSTVPAPTKVPVPATSPSQDSTPAAPAPVPATATQMSYPTPAKVAERITGKPQPPTRVPEPATAPVARPTSARPSTPSAPAAALTPSSTGLQAAAKDAVQLVLPLANPELLAPARQAARDYLAEHGTRINAAQLARRLKIPSDQAAQLLKSINDTTPATSTVNGRQVNAQ